MPETEKQPLVVNRLWVYYGDGEYSRELTEQALASDYAHRGEYRMQWPLIVTATEHGGWSMTYYFDVQHPKGICIGTANDAAQFSPEQRELMERLYHRTENHIGEVRRPPVSKRA
jgi:hypothetical protein